MKIDLKKYETRAEAQERIGLSEPRVLRLLREGRFEGAFQVPELKNQWFIPRGAYPTPPTFKHTPEERAKMREYQQAYRARQNQQEGVVDRRIMGQRTRRFAEQLTRKRED